MFVSKRISDWEKEIAMPSVGDVNDDVGSFTVDLAAAAFIGISYEFIETNSELTDMGNHLIDVDAILTSSTTTGLRRAPNSKRAFAGERVTKPRRR
jgi:hypothetical protein